MAALPLHGIKACVFDAYGTLFDFASAAKAVGTRWATAPSARHYGATNNFNTPGCATQSKHADFWQVTGDALDSPWKHSASGTENLRDRLMNCI